MTTHAAADRITKARTRIVLDDPFLATLILRLPVIEDLTCPTLWTDGTQIAYNPEFIDRILDCELRGVLAHEIWHCILDHIGRMGQRDRQVWNIATDYIVNQTIAEFSYVLPQGALYSYLYSGKTPEEVYNILMSEPKPPQQAQPQTGCGAQQDGGEAASAPQPCTDPGGCGEVRQPKSGAGKTVAEVADEWKLATSQAVRIAKKAGKFPGNVERVIRDILEPKLDWRALLKRFFDITAWTTYGWLPPARRHIGSGRYLPSYSGKQLGRIAVAVDCSGSIHGRMLAEIGGELNGIASEMGAGMTVLYFDTKVRDVVEVEHDDLPIVICTRAGGGTDFAPIFHHPSVEDVSCLVVLTDMEASFDAIAEPPYPLLWVNFGSEGLVAPVGETIHVR